MVSAKEGVSLDLEKLSGQSRRRIYLSSKQREVYLKYFFFFPPQRVLAVVVYLIIEKNEKWYPISSFQVDVHASGSE